MATVAGSGASWTAGGNAAGLGLAATTYSIILAALNAHGFGIGLPIVIGVEIAILFTGLVVIIITSPLSSDPIVLAVLIAVIAINSLVSFLSQVFAVDLLRDWLVILVFCALGQRCSPAGIARLLAITNTIVLAVLLLEVIDLPAYVTTFQPALFYQATRGAEIAAYNTTGLWGGAINVEGHFNVGFYTGPRTSSIFLEMVSNANFAAIDAILLLSLWPRLGILVRLLTGATIALILLTTNSRFGTGFVVMLLFGQALFPRLPKRGVLLVFPFIALVALAIYAVLGDTGTDDLVGRTAAFAKLLRDATPGFYLGFDGATAKTYVDNGYGFIIAGGSLIGFVLFWLYVSLFPRADDALSRKLAYGTALYIFSELLISGTSVLSIKTGALLWLMVGHTRALPAVTDASRA